MIDDSENPRPLEPEVNIPAQPPAAAAAPTAPAAPQARRGQLLLPVIVACALFMENLDSTVLATSLPAISRSLEIHPIALKLAMTSYLLALAVCLPASGWLADRFGARVIFRIAIAIFAAGSIGCGFSENITEIVIARIIQGIGGSMMVPVGRLIVLRSVPKSEIVGAMAWMTIPALIGPLLGPLVGGFITTYFDWRWIFWINVPIAVLGLVMATLHVPNIRGETRTRFDAIGFILMGAGIATFVSGSTALGVGLLPGPDVVAIAGFGAVLIVGYVFYSRRRTDPILDLSLFRVPTLRSSLLGGMFVRFGMGGTPFLLPLLMQFGFGMTPFQSGAVTFVSSIGAIGLKTVSTRILRRFGFRTVVLANTALMAAFLAAPALFTLATPLIIFYLVLLAGGFFRSLQMTSTNILAYVDLPSERMSQATTLSSVFQQVSMSIGISIAALSLQTQIGPSGDIMADDFFWPFVTLGVAVLGGWPFFWALAKNAGGEVSGHKLRSEAG